MHEVAIILALVVLNGLLAGAEIAVLSIRAARLTELAAKGGNRVRALAWLRADPERFLATVQVGMTFVSAGAAAYGGASLSSPVQHWLEHAGVEADLAGELALLAVVSLVGFLSVVLGELVPKSVALRKSEAVALAAAPALVLLARLTRPLSWTLTATSNLVLKPWKDHTNFSESRLSVEEVQLVLAEASRTGSIDRGSADIANRALDLAHLTAQAVAVPRHKVAALQIDMGLQEAVAVILDSGHARLPVFGETPDQIEGYIHSRDVVSAFVGAKAVTLAALLKPPLLVPWSTRAIDLLRRMQTAQEAIALITDEHGGLLGLVTFEDLVEELVGEIRTADEREPPAIQPQTDGTVVLTGGAAIREINRVLDRGLPESQEWTTVAGLCAALAGQIPGVDAVLEVPGDGCSLRILAATPQRVESVLLVPQAEGRPPTAGSRPGSGGWSASDGGRHS